jgi:NAD(P) transhydrogenase subunit beta
MAETVIQVAYLMAAFLFITALRALGRPDSARRGMQLAAFGMAMAVAATLLQARIVTFEWIAVGAVIGSVAGYPLGRWVPMTAMPQRIALSHALGALAATLVGVGEYSHDIALAAMTRSHVLALSFEVLLGSLTVTGSAMAFGKLQEILPGRPVIFPYQNFVNLVLVAAAVGCLGWLIAYPMDARVFVSMIGIAALDGLSGLILSLAMSKAMNRSFANVLFGAFGAEGSVGSAAAAGGEMSETNAENAALRLAYGERVIMVPGYGLAVSQAQHQMRELGELIQKRGGDVRYAIHPVAGRMPGHMNVLLAEAGVPYDKLIDMEEINERFTDTDVAVVVGANDVVNPAAQTNRASPIYGMPILKVADAKSVLVLKRGRGKGFSGVDNDLFVDPKTSMLFGDARQSLLDLGAEVKSA